MNKKLPTMTEKEKIDYLLEKVERIDATINPSFKKRVLQWSLNHWIFLIAIILLGYGMIEMREEIQALITFVQQVDATVDTVQEEFSGLKQSLQNVSDGVGKTVDSIKFWD